MAEDLTRCMLDSRLRASRSNYNKHIKDGVLPDRACQIANNKWMAEYRKRKGRRKGQ